MWTCDEQLWQREVERAWTSVAVQAAGKMEPGIILTQNQYDGELSGAGNRDNFAGPVPRWPGVHKLCALD